MPPGQRLSDRQVADVYRAPGDRSVFIDTSNRPSPVGNSAATQPTTHAELEWSLVGLWSLLLYASDELNRQEIPLNASLLRAVCERSAKSPETTTTPPKQATRCDNDFADAAHRHLPEGKQSQP
ncbi:MAG: hypothetical protein R3C02_03690 [Planctomycetaceae bacterium]